MSQPTEDGFCPWKEMLQKMVTSWRDLDGVFLQLQFEFQSLSRFSLETHAYVGQAWFYFYATSNIDVYHDADADN